MKISVGKKLYFSILSVFLVFAVAFIVFQQDREKQFKIDTLNLKLQDYNSRMEEYLRLFPDFSEEALDRYVHTHYIPNIRVTLIRNDGKVLYDSKLKDYSNIANHATRPEMAAASGSVRLATKSRSPDWQTMPRLRFILSEVSWCIRAAARRFRCQAREYIC